MSVPRTLADATQRVTDAARRDEWDDFQHALTLYLDFAPALTLDDCAFGGTNLSPLGLAIYYASQAKQAAGKEDPEITTHIRRLLDRGASPNAWARYQSETPVCYAATYRLFNIVDLLLKAGASADLHDRQGRGLIHHIDFFLDDTSGRLLASVLATNVDVDALDGTGHTALMRVVSHASLQQYGAGRDAGAVARAIRVIDALVERGADVNAKQGAVLRFATSTAAPAIIEALCEHGASLHLRDEAGRGVLAGVQRAAVIDLLADLGAEPDARDRLGRTALLEAMEKVESPDVLAALLRAGADPLISSYRDPANTALRMAADSKRDAGVHDMMKASVARQAAEQALRAGVRLPLPSSRAPVSRH